MFCLQENESILSFLTVENILPLTLPIEISDKLNVALFLPHLVIKQI